MTQEEKSLLLQDLCARLPYMVEVYYGKTIPISTLKTINSEKESCIIYDHSQWYRHTKVPIKEIKPYLRKMSSMTEEERKHWRDISLSCPDWDFTARCLDWLNSHHFDYRGLIEKGLALEAPNGMYYG